MVQICRLENIEHENIKQISYSGKYSLLARRAHQSHLQFSFVLGMLSLRYFHPYTCKKRGQKAFPTTKENCRRD